MIISCNLSSADLRPEVFESFQVTGLITFSSTSQPEINLVTNNTNMSRSEFITLSWSLMCLIQDIIKHFGFSLSA